MHLPKVKFLLICYFYPAKENKIISIEIFDLNLTYRAKNMFNQFEETVLENMIRIVPEQYKIYQIPQIRLLNDEKVEGTLYVVIEGKHSQKADKTKEILHFRLSPVMWLENSAKDIFRRSQWYGKFKTKGWINTFQLCIDHNEKIVRFGPSGNLMIRAEDLRGLGIGTFLWHLLIKWAKSKVPDYDVYRIEISSVDATEDNRERRNHFFQKHGFTPQFDDPDGRSGYYYCKKVSDLRESDFIPDWDAKDPVEMTAFLLQDKEDSDRKIYSLERELEQRWDSYINLSEKNDRLKHIIVGLSVAVFCCLGLLVLQIF